MWFFWVFDLVEIVVEVSWIGVEFSICYVVNFLNGGIEYVVFGVKVNRYCVWDLRMLLFIVLNGFVVGEGGFIWFNYN